MSPSSMLTLAIDLGGTSLRIALVDGAGAIQQQARYPTPAGGDPDRLAELIRDAQARLDIRSTPLNPIAGVALAGIRDPQDVMQRAVHLPLLEGVPLRTLFESVLGRAVQIETDVNAAALAQLQRFQATGARSERFAYASFGTGVGVGVVLHGLLVRHTRSGAGHFGHITVDASRTAELCACGGRGCLELAARRLVSQGACSGDAEALRQVCIGLATLATVYAPDTVALGGGMLDHAPAVAQQIIDAFDEQRTSLMPSALRIVPAPLRSDDAGVIGAAAIAQSAC